MPKKETRMSERVKLEVKPNERVKFNPKKNTRVKFSPPKAARVKFRANAAKISLVKLAEILGHDVSTIEIWRHKPAGNDWKPLPVIPTEPAITSKYEEYHRIQFYEEDLLNWMSTEPWPRKVGLAERYLRKKAEYEEDTEEVQRIRELAQRAVRKERTYKKKIVPEIVFGGRNMDKAYLLYPASEPGMPRKLVKIVEFDLSVYH
jgi:hypothetical protein